MKLFIAPLEFFRARANRPPSWWSALAILASACGGTVAVALVAVRRSRAALEPTLAAAGTNTIPTNLIDVIVVITAVMGFVASFSLMTGALVFLDSLFSRSGKVDRLVEFSALAHAVQLPWVLVAIGLTLWGPVPAAQVPAGPLDGAELREISEQYLAAFRSSPVQEFGRLMSTYMALWLVALQGCALRVVSGFSVRGAWAAGCTLALVFGIGPWAWQTFWSR